MTSINTPTQPHTAADGKGILITGIAMQHLAKHAIEQENAQVLRVGVR